jgi:phosphoglycerate dehydrogenase-like enzyme
MARIFICGDTGQTGLLDRTAGALSLEGHHVIRGPADDGGRLRRYTQSERAELINTADVAVFTTRHECSSALLAGASRLRGVCYPVTGVETLDVAAASELGIIVGHGAVSENAVGMAEATLMLMLMLLYDVEGNIARMRSGAWRRPMPVSRQMAGKTVGLIGFGRIAREVAVRLVPFKARVLTYSPRARVEDLPEDVAKVDLPALLRESDVVSVLTSLTNETRHMIGARELQMMKREAWLVNTGRGEIVEEGALFEVLQARRIAGAALDAFATEPLPQDSPFRALDNVILTPHSVGHTVEGVGAIEPALLENIRRILLDQLPLICKNPQAEPAWRQRLHRLALGQTPL